MLRKLHSERHRLSRTVTEQSSVTDYKIVRRSSLNSVDGLTSLAESVQAGCARLFRDFVGRVIPFFRKSITPIEINAEFQNVAMIAGISLIMNPQAPYATEMKDIIRLFMEQHPCDSAADDFTQQEATIVSSRCGVSVLTARSLLYIDAT